MALPEGATPLQFTASFYRTAAICSALSAITTLMLIFLPNFFLPWVMEFSRLDRGA